MVYIPIVIFYIIFAIGAGVRYSYFMLIGKKRKYDDLIAPNIQTLWNLLLSLIVIGTFLFLVYKFDHRKTDRTKQSIEILLNKKY